MNAQTQNFVNMDFDESNRLMKIMLNKLIKSSDWVFDKLENYLNIIDQSTEELKSISWIETSNVNIVEEQVNENVLVNNIVEEIKQEEIVTIDKLNDERETYRIRSSIIDYIYDNCYENGYKESPKYKYVFTEIVDDLTQLKIETIGCIDYNDKHKLRILIANLQ